MAYVSVIIPIYNAARYLNKSISNYLLQDYKDIEFILVDDGSKDESLSICRHLEKHYQNIKVIHQENSGVSAARNTGIKNSSGKYLAFFDADDYVDKTMISNMVSEACRCDADIVSCGISMDLEKKNGQITTQSQLFFPNSPLVLSCKNEISSKMLEIWEYAVPYNVVNKLIKRSLLVSNNIEFENLSMGEDLLFNSRVLPFCTKIVLLPNCCYHYIREREGAATASYVNEWFRIRKEENERILDFFKNYRKSESLSVEDREYIARRFVNRTLGCMENEFRMGNKGNKYNQIKTMIDDNDVQESLEIGDHFSFKIKVIAWLMRHKLYLATYFVISVVSRLKRISPRLFEYLKYRR